MRRLSLGLAALLAAACARSSASNDAAIPLDAAHLSSAHAVRDATLATSRAFEHVRGLTDEAGPRLAGSPGDAAGVAWAERTMKGLGLADVHTETVTVPRWERGLEQAEMVAPTRRALFVTALGGSVATPPEGIEADVVEIDSEEALSRLSRADVEGKILFVHVPMDRTKDGSGYGKAVQWRGRAAIEGAKRGAVATIIRSVGTDGDRAPHTGAFGYDDNLPKIPAGALSVPDAEVLHRTLATGTRARVKLVLITRFLPDATSANVIGEVRGATRPDEIVLLGAHLDSWDLGDGAADDGAGCAIVLEAARQISLVAARPARTVRVVLFANEENGLRGARAYAAAHAAELDKHVAAIEADSGDGRTYATRIVAGEGQAAFAGLARLVAPLGAALDASNAEGGADLIPLRAAGVPLVDLRQDETRYFDVHHTANDTLARIVKADLDHTTAAMATIAYGLASTSATFGRTAAHDRDRKR